MISPDTRGSSLYLRMSTRRPAAAYRNTRFTASTDIACRPRTTRSVIDPSHTGTRRAVLARRPSTAGSTAPVANAPVEVGVILMAAARTAAGLCAARRPTSGRRCRRGRW